METFTTKIESRDLDLWMKNHDIEVEQDFEVTFELEFEMRSYGIKDTCIHIKKITGDFTKLCMDSPDDTEPEYIEFVYDPYDDKFKDWAIDNCMKFNEWGGLSADHLEIDFDRKTITVGE